MTARGYRTVLVVSVEAMSAVVDPEEFLYQTIFGDGAGAVVIRDEPGSVYGIEAIRTHTDAAHCDWTWAPGGGTKHPITTQVLAERSQFLSLDYKAIYRFAVDKMVDATHEVLNAIDLTVDDVDWLIPHQTGTNIIGDTVERLKIDAGAGGDLSGPHGQRVGGIGGHRPGRGPTERQLFDGDRIVLTVVGGGMAWGAVSMLWRTLGRAVAAVRCSTAVTRT